MDIPINLVYTAFYVFTGVTSMGYCGSYPVSKLTITDKSFGDLQLDLFAISALKPRDSKSSSTPAVAFTLRVKNPSSNAAQVSFMLNLPLGIQPDTQRLGKPYANFKGLNFTQCARICNLERECMSWQVITTNQTCHLFRDVPPHSWHPTITSGQKSTWTVHDSMLTLNRPGKYPQSGNTTILTEDGVSSSFTVTNSFADIWKQFDAKGYLKSSFKSNTSSGFYGAACVKVTVKPEEEKAVTMVLGWFYPNRDFTGMLTIRFPFLDSLEGMTYLSPHRRSVHKFFLFFVIFCCNRVILLSFRNLMRCTKP